MTSLSTYFRNNDKIVSFDELQYFTGLTKIYGGGSSSSPQGAFYDCNNLRSITVPDGVTSLSYSAFKSCSSLRKVVLPESLTIIGESAFSGCSNLIDAKIPDGVSEIYSSADLFVNPTKEETFPTVNMEALACGTPVLTFKTGGSPEILDESCGLVISQNDLNTLKNKIIETCEKRMFSPEACVNRALCFEKNKKYQEYIDLYKEIINE